MASKRKVADDWIRAYYNSLQDGSITAGQWIHKLYNHIIKGLDDGLFFYDIDKANRAVRFLEAFLHHNKGHLAPGLVKLELWQKAMISCIFGLVDSAGLRKYKEVLCVVGRKCGKSLLASGIAEYMAYADGEQGADVFFLAPRLEQTEIVFNAFWQSVSKEPALAEITKKRKTDIYIERTNTSIKKIAFSQKKSDGFNPHLTICDEIAAWQGDAGIKQYEVMTSALGSRRQPLVVSITTANYVSDGIYDDLMKRATRILQGESKETGLLPFLYIIDDVEKWNDLTELRKSLPNLGVSVSEAFIKEEIAKAEGSLTNRREFLCKFCNVKQNSSQAWLSATDITACFQTEPLKLEDFRRCYCVGGIDLSQTTDLTAAVAVIEKNERLFVFAHFWLPEGRLEEATARDGIPYDIYLKQGWLSLSGDSFVDYHDCHKWFDELMDTYRIYPQQIGYDRYSSQYLVQEMRTTYQMDDVYQGTNLTPVIREVEGLVKGKKFNFGNNELLKIHLLNSALKLEVENNRCKLVKIKPQDHIDGTAALLDAMCVRQKWWSEIGLRLQNKDR